MSELLVINEKTIALDSEGFLCDLGDWSKDVAIELAHRENIELTESHWEIIFCLRKFYEEFELSPAMRPLVKYISQQLGQDKGRSIFLMTLFPQSPAKIASKIAGLPKPTNCL